MAVSLGGDGLGNNGASAAAIAAEQATFPQLYASTDRLNETIDNYWKLYNTESVEGDRPIEEAPSLKTTREVLEAAEENVTPSEYESVNRAMLLRTTFYARKKLEEEEKRLEAILNHEPVPRVFDPYEFPMSEFEGPITMKQRREREARINEPYINYDDPVMVASEVAAQEERVAKAQKKLDEKLELAKLPELPKPPHMADPNVESQPKLQGPVERIREKLQDSGPKPVSPLSVNDCDVQVGTTHFSVSCFRCTCTMYIHES